MTDKMKFTVRHAGENQAGKAGEATEIEITTLEELRDFAKSVNETLIIKFAGVTSNAWYPYGKPDKKMSEEQEIIIYDDYVG